VATNVDTWNSTVSDYPENEHIGANVKRDTDSKRLLKELGQENVSAENLYEKVLKTPEVT
jgi:hypothetical protein